MNLRGVIAGLRVRGWAWLAKRRALRGVVQDPTDIRRGEWDQSLARPTEFYFRAFRQFHRSLPTELRAHRGYFTKHRRGFGEDAFHTLWYLLHEEFRIQSFLEIGVYRGQTLSLVSLLQQRAGRKGEVAGISPFLPVGDSVSRYRQGVAYYEDTLRNFDRFRLPRPRLLKAYSTDPEALALIASREWDCIYIDGNHDYPVAKADWIACSQAVKTGGVIVLDDSALATDFVPPPFATKGHPGPSQVADEIDRVTFREILRVGHNRAFQKLPHA